MKKILLKLVFFLVALIGMAQAPNMLNYQGIARNSLGIPLQNQPIRLHLSILSGSSSGTVVYEETRDVTTNRFGLFTVKVGDPAGIISQTGTIAGVNWSGLPIGTGASKYLKVEIDPEGGNNFQFMGTTQMLSVPYALNAGNATPVGPAGGDLTGTFPNPQILFPLIKTFNFPNSQLIKMTNSSTTGILGAITGVSASNDSGATAISGQLTSLSGGMFSAAVKGTNNATGNNGVGVFGSHNGSGFGVYGIAQSGVGVYGQSISGVGVYGISKSWISGWFQNIDSTNISNVLVGQTNGTGRVGYFLNTNSSNPSNILEVQSSGGGRAGFFQNTS